MARLEPEELRRLLLSSSSLHDTRIEEALRAGSVWIHHAFTTWESSEGEISGHLVGLALDATLLAHIAPDPHCIDVLTAAAAVAVARRPRESLCELRVHWNGALRNTGNYRGDSVARAPFEAALTAYLEARGENSAWALAKQSHIVRAPGAQGWEVTVATPRMISTMSRDFQAIVEACKHLLSGAECARVRVMRI